MWFISKLPKPQQNSPKTMAQVKVEREGVENDKLSVSRDEGPCFFKIIVTSLTPKELRIPPSFMKHIKTDGSNTATLNGPCGGCWSVKLGQKENGTFLQEGLKEFIRDSSIRESDFLLFTYEGNLCFNVQIFDKSGLERTDTSDARKQLNPASSGVKQKRVGRPRKDSLDPQQSNPCRNGIDGTGDGIHEEATPSNGKRKRGRPRKAISAPVHPQQSDGTADGKQQDVEAEVSNGKGKHGRTRKQSVAPLNRHPPMSSRDDPGGVKHQEAGPSSGKRKPGRPIKNEVAPVKLSELVPSGHASGEQTEERALTIWEPDSQPKGVEEEKDGPSKRELNKTDKRHELSRTCPPNGEEVARAWQRSKSYTPNFSHYRCCLEECHVHNFILPISEPFPRTCFPPFETLIVLKNSKGEGWPVNLAASERPSFSGGWCSFVLENNLRQGDVCIFELVHKNEMQVHIFRCSSLDDSSLVPRQR